MIGTEINCRILTRSLTRCSLLHLREGGGREAREETILFIGTINYKKPLPLPLVQLLQKLPLFDTFSFIEIIVHFPPQSFAAPKERSE